MNEPTNTETTNETLNAYCDVCDSQQNGTESQLRNNGWYLGRNEQFCPCCND